METNLDFLTKKYGKTHHITKRMGVTVNMTYLNPNQFVFYGDGKTYYYLLTERDFIDSSFARHPAFTSIEYVSPRYEYSVEMLKKAIKKHNKLHGDQIVNNFY